MAQHLPIDWVIVRDVVSVLFTGLGAMFFRKTERTRRINNETVDRLNGHVETVDQLQEEHVEMASNILRIRRHMGEQSRRIRSLEQSREHAAIERRALQTRIEELEARKS